LDISVLAKNVVAVDPIEDEDGKKAETAVSSLLEKADQTYKQQQFMKAGLESMLQSIKEKKSMAGLSAFPSSSSSSNAQSNIAGPSAVSMPVSYASAAANALNNNISIGSNNAIVGGGNIMTIGGTGGGSAAAVAGMLSGLSGGGAGPSLSGAAGSLVLKNVQSLAYCYAIDCKSSYEELNRIMRKVGAYRREMLKIDPLAYTLDSVDTVTYRKYNFTIN
jgi:hypothetical protein